MKADCSLLISNWRVPTFRTRLRVLTAMALCTFSSVMLDTTVVSAAIGTPTNIGSAFVSGSAGTSIAISATSNVPAGNVVIVTFTMKGSSGAVSCTDSKSNAYAVDVDTHTNGVRTVICSSMVSSAITTSPATTITVTHPSVDFRTAVAFQVSGLRSSGWLDRWSAATGSGTAPSSGSTATTTVADELLVGAFGIDTKNAGFMAGSGYSSLGSIVTGSTGNDISHAAEYRIVSATGAYAATATTSNNPWSAVIATYKGRRCGDGTVDIDEACDDGVTNGTADSCCSSSCAFKPSGTACTDDSNVCTTDMCSGSSSVCEHAAGNAGAVCRAAGPDGCDVAETCTGLSASCPSDGVRPSGTICRAASGECDLSEVCDGSSHDCPADVKKTDGTACTSDGNPCTRDECNGSIVSCQHPAGNAGTVCRAAAGECDVVESCTGTSTACPVDGFLPAMTACGSAADTECDNPDTCDGAGHCEVNHEPTTTACGDAEGPCTNVDACDGDGLCNDSGFKPASTPCGDPSDTVCDNPDHCTGIDGACDPSHEPTTTACGDAEGPCTNVDACDGDGLCNDSGFKPASTPCGDPSDTVCDNPDHCTGTDGACDPSHEPTTTACGDAEGPCTSADACDGDGLCHDSGFKPASTPCGDPSDTVCDNPDHCTGIDGACDPSHEPTTTACGDAEGPCTSADACDGDGLCHDNGFKPASTPCGDPSDTVCDNPDRCSGIDGACDPSHEPTTTACGDAEGPCTSADACDGDGLCNDSGFKPASTPCGDPSDTVCDNPDHCTGIDGACDPSHEPTTTACRPAGDSCDVAESCDGFGACSVDRFEPSTTLCRAAAGPCDVEENCTGLSGACPVDTYVPDGTECRAASGACDIAELCTGFGAECPDDTLSHTSTMCRPSSGAQCDPPEYCDGVHIECPADVATASPPVGSTVRVTHDSQTLTTTIAWTETEPGPFNVYRGLIDGALPWSYNQSCFSDHTISSTTDASTPSVGAAFFYLVSRHQAPCPESSLGEDFRGIETPNTSACPR